MGRSEIKGCIRACVHVISEAFFNRHIKTGIASISSALATALSRKSVRVMNAPVEESI